MTLRLTWPADRFYWAVLDAPGVKHTGPLPAGLLPMLEEDAPADATDLHAVCVPLADGRLVVCAAGRSDLAEVPPDVLSLTPCSLPCFVESLGVTAERFNLLVGAFEPRPIRAHRIKQHAFAAATILLCGLLVGVGLHRRCSRWEERAESARVAAASIAEKVTTTGRADDIAAEAARLKGVRDALAKAAPQPDASLSLAAVLHAWPANVPSKPQSISVSSTGVSISVSVEGDAAAFLKAFTPPPGWTLDEPRLNTADKVTRLALQLRPLGGKP
jgi:hypothetical protein